MKDEVSTFIRRFTENDRTIDTFMNGCCYWFAFALFRRFLSDGAVIMYDEVDNHFGTKIGDKVYDISGDVTDKYDWEVWTDIEDSLLREHVIRDCIMF